MFTVQTPVTSWPGTVSGYSGHYMPLYECGVLMKLVQLNPDGLGIKHGTANCLCEH